jgi:hypothetical protein
MAPLDACIITIKPFHGAVLLLCSRSQIVQWPSQRLAWGSSRHCQCPISLFFKAHYSVCSVISPLVQTEGFSHDD